jgi:hypothetical protein
VPTRRLAGALPCLVLLGSVCAYSIWLHLIIFAGGAAASAFHFMMFMMPPLGPRAHRCDMNRATQPEPAR